MNKQIPALALCAALLLTGCSSMLERDYVSVSPHPPFPAVVDDSNAIRVETYQQLSNALWAMVKAHQESGVIRLRNYTPTAGSTVEGDLTRAREEVYHDDPLGNFAIDSIDTDLERIVMYYEATVTIAYRRTKEQVDAVTEVTGAGAIRTQLRAALSGFRPEVALKLNYFSEDADYIRALIHETYYDTPAAALGMPQAEVSLYPDSGFQRIVEVAFTYPGDPEALHEQSRALSAEADSLLLPLRENNLRGDDLARALLTALTDRMAAHAPREAAPVSTAWCLVEGVGDSQGLALAYQLLCDAAGLESQVVEGALDGEPHFWTILSAKEGHRHVDPSLGLDGFLLTDQEMADLGYVWSAADYPACGESEENLQNTP